MKNNNVPVFTGKLANYLLNNGFTIACVGLNPANPKRSVFYFRPDNSIRDEIQKFTNKNK